jgi:hypothetical protein
MKNSVELSFSVEMIERVLREWQEENPLRTPESMTSDEFAQRMMIEIKASARIAPDA